MKHTLFDLLSSATEKTPSKLFVVSSNGEPRSTYRNATDRSSAVAGTLSSLGVQKGDRVLIWLSDAFDCFVSASGISKIGGIFITISPKSTYNQALHIITDAQPSIIICEDVLDHARLTRLCQSKLLKWTEIDWNANSGDAAVGYTDELAALVYTSGSTGLPKGVMVSALNFSEAAERVAAYLKNSDLDRTMTVLPFNAPWGVLQWMTMLIAGGSIATTPKTGFAGDIVTTIESACVTGMAALPFTWIQLIGWLSANKIKLDSLRYVTCSGGVLPENTLKAMPTVFPRAEIYLTYGLTEAFRTTVVPPEWFERKMGSLGRPCKGVEISILRNDGTMAATGEIGELVHKGACVTHGYWHRPEETMASFAGCHWENISQKTQRLHYSGDLVKSDKDGFLWFVGRKDFQIKTGGYRVSPDEISQSALSSGIVSQAIAWGEPHSDLGQEIVLVVSPSSELFSHDALKKWLRETLPSYARPARVLIWANPWPLTANGKIDRSELMRLTATVANRTS